MRKKIHLILIFMITAGSLYAQNPREKIETAMAKTELKGMESLSQMILRDNRGNERIRETYMYSAVFGDTEKSVIRFLAPADIKGTSMLTWDKENAEDDMWLFLPALGKSRRIVSTEKSKTFMGSEFTYSDLSDPNLDDFTFEELGMKTKEANQNLPDPEKKEYQVIRLTPKTEALQKEYGFSYRDVYLDPDTGLISRAVYTDRRGRLERTMDILNISLVEGTDKYRPRHLVVFNHQNKRSSSMIIKQIKVNNNLGENLFTTRYIEN